MSSDRTSSNTATNQSEQERWELAHSLSTDTTVTLNGEYPSLTVSHIRPNAEGGDTTEITLLEEGTTTFVIHASNEEPAIPLLTQPDGEKVPITSITAADDNILSNITARDLYGSTVTDTTASTSDPYPTERNPTPELDATELSIIGDCPKCDCIVAEKDEQAICTNCGSWTPLDQWNAYHDTGETDTDNPSDSSNGLTQQTLGEACSTDT